MDRRKFLTTSCTGACVALGSGFVMSALLSACKTPLGVIKTNSSNNHVTIPLSEFAQADYKLVRVNNYNYDLAVQKKADGSFHVLVLKCTHAAQPLTKTGNSYYCTLHGSQFSKTGEVLKGPAERHLIELPTSLTNKDLTIKLDMTI
jgi:Rieske Fe-S protein